MDIPNLGTFYIRKNIAAIAFDGFLVNDVLVKMLIINKITNNALLQDATNKTLKEQKSKNSNLTVDNLQSLLEGSRAQVNYELSKEDVNSINADEGGKNYLMTHFGIDFDRIKGKSY